MILPNLITQFMEQANVTNMNHPLYSSETIIVDKNLLMAFRNGKLTPSASMLDDIMKHLSNIGWVTEENYDQLYNEKTYLEWLQTLDYDTNDRTYKLTELLGNSNAKSIVSAFTKFFDNENHKSIDAEITDEAGFKTIIDNETLNQKDGLWIERELRYYFFNKGYYARGAEPSGTHENQKNHLNKTFERRYYDDVVLIDTGLKDWWYNHFLNQLESFLNADIETYSEEETEVVNEILKVNRNGHKKSDNLSHYTLPELLSKQTLNLDELLDLNILRINYKGKNINPTQLKSALNSLLDRRKVSRIKDRNLKHLTERETI